MALLKYLASYTLGDVAEEYGSEVIEQLFYGDTTFEVIEGKLY